MNSLRVNQQDARWEVGDISRMAEYYSQAPCCVVVSEMLRRRYSHSWEVRGIDDKYELELPKGYKCEVGSA